MGYGFLICGLSFLVWGHGLLFSIYGVFVAVEAPWFGLQLSCFGHVRAKTHSELPCRLELCLTFCLGLSPVILLLHKAVKGLFCCWYAVVVPLGCAGLANL